MPPMIPKFDKYLKEKADDTRRAIPQSRHGIIMSYNPINNTATVMMSSPTSDNLGEILRYVPCPVSPGVQGVAPEPGRPCWVVFEGNNGRQPMITHYYNHDFQHFEYAKHSRARTGVPGFNLAM